MKSVSFDPAAGFVTIAFTGSVDDSEWFAAFEEIERAAPSHWLLIDLSEAQTRQLTSLAVRKSALHMSPAVLRGCALVASELASFGLARMFEIYADNPGVAAFRDLDSARKWLAKRLRDEQR